MRIWFLLCAVLISQINIAQNAVEYTNFNAVKIDKVVRIDFTLNSGSTCNGIYIERGTDSFNLIEIGSFAGQCGSPLEPVHYSFIDENPIINSDNYYRLNFGGAEISNVISLHFAAVGYKEISINPNPNNGEFDLVFNNPLMEEWHVEFVSILGEVVYITSVNSEKIHIELPDVVKGIYYVRLSNYNNNSLIVKGLVNIL